MPARSKAQLRKIAELEKQGKVKPGTTKEWAEATPNLKALPERITPKAPRSIQEIKEIAVKKFGRK